ncbi:MAG: manganese efflux pump MntP family protein [Candidatus Paceibacterota bacterium]|jgi:putative Mn2+ efflux pump MntP|nr:manganese efflux pump MntP family protein [Candidatus Paceibacterota bacterium]
MNIFDIFLTGFSLSLDAVAIAVAAGALHKIDLRHAVKIAVFFGGFQMFMPLIGWMAGLGWSGYLESYGNMIGFVLLFAVGLKMLLETFKKETKEEVKQEKHLAETKTLTIMAVATSIDALVVGITFNFVPVNIPLAVGIIGAVTFVLSLAAVYIGEKFKRIIGKEIEWLGGLVLIGLSIKILLS